MFTISKPFLFDLLKKSVTIGALTELIFASTEI